MAVEIKRPGDTLGQKPKLSRFGKGVVAAGIVAVIIVAAIVIGSLNASAKKQELARPVLDAISHSLLVCENVKSAAGDAALSDKMAAVEKQSDVKKKADAALDMISHATGLVKDNQSLLDELSGARNRISVALRQYEKG